MVDSTCHSLRRLALALASQKPVLLEGPIGCGKTSLVEFLAAATGHVQSRKILKVQLGDQTDSKVRFKMPLVWLQTQPFMVFEFHDGRGSITYGWFFWIGWWLHVGKPCVWQMLLGMYRCTDIPGKFVWQPGTLTQAVTKGHWILLEDIDHAPLDVVSSS